MKKAILNLKTGLTNAWYNLYLITIEKEYNQDEIAWIHSEIAADLFTSLEANIQKNIYSLSDSPIKLNQYIRIVYYEVLKYSLLQFQRIGSHWLKKGVPLSPEILKDRNFLIIHNGYIPAISHMMNIFRSELKTVMDATFPEDINDKIIITLNDFSITGNYSKDIVLIYPSDQQISFSWTASQAQKEALWEALKGAGYIDKGTTKEAFTAIFSGSEIDINLLPVTWICKNRKGTVNKTALREFLTLLLGKFQEKIVPLCFIDINKYPISLNKPKKNEYSTYLIKLEDIIDSVNKQLPDH
jgi:hypothetical protein